MMEAIVLAGGKGARLGTLTENTPKPLLKVGEKPFLEYVLAYLKKEGVSRVILATGYLHQEIQTYFGADCRGLALAYTIERELLGTGGAIKLALSQAHTRTVLVLNGDTFFPVPISELVNFHDAHSADITIALARPREASRYGRVALERDFLPVSVKNLKVYGFPWDGYFIDIGIPEDYRKAQIELASI